MVIFHCTELLLSFPTIAIFLVYSTRDLRESTQEANLMSSAAIAAAVRENVAKLKRRNA